MCDVFYVIKSLAFVLALSVDTFAASLANSAQGIKIPKKAAVLISFASAAIGAFGIEIGGAVCPYLPKTVISAVSILILAGLGFIKLFEFSIKRCIRRNNTRKDFYFLKFHFLLEIICDSTQADTDLSKELSAKEALMLALALSLDGFTAGISAGLLGFNSGVIFLLSFAFGLAAIAAGKLLGKAMSEKTEQDLSWISGAILIMLALIKL